MATPPRHLVCTKCFVGQELAPEQTFLGFYRFHCHACGSRCKYPLSTTYRVIYIVLVALLVVAIVGAAAGKNLGGGCGIFSVGAMIALGFDLRTRAKVKHAEANEKVKPEAVAATFE